MKRSNGKHRDVRPRRQRGYPRPMLERAGWTPLDGRWEFAIDHDGQVLTPEAVNWDTNIEVPFAPETPASGVNETGLFKAVWYRRTFEAPKAAGDRRVSPSRRFRPG